MKVVAVVQARTGSTRLPGKVLLPLGGKPMLARMIERVKAARSLDDVIVATTTNEEDDVIRRLCKAIGVPVFSGHPTDLLDRHYRAASVRGADVVAKIPSDCPLVDPRVIDRVVSQFRVLRDVDYVSNLHPATYPDGNDVELVPMHVLETAWCEADRDFEREHTTPYIWDQPERFRLANVAWETGLDYSMSHRFTVDYPEDFSFVDAVYRELHVEGGTPFLLGDVVGLLEQRPDIFRINAHLAGVNWYRGHMAELRTIRPHETVLPENE